MISYNWDLNDWMSRIILQIRDNFYLISIQVLTKEKQNTRRVYQDSRWYIQNLGIFKTRSIFRTLVYQNFWHIQNQRHIENPGLFGTLEYSEPEAYSEHCQTSRMERFDKQLMAIIVFYSSYNYFRNISF